MYHGQLRFTRLLLGSMLILLSSVATSGAETFNIGIMQAQAGVAKKYAALETYLKKSGIDMKFVAIPSYTAAADMFAKGQVDGMFSGSGVAGALIIKKVAYPIVRPVDKQGRSTYWAVVVAKKGSKPFDGTAAYFNGKKVAFCSLASSGEFFYKSLPGSDRINAQVIEAPNHQDALTMVDKGTADVAIVKNMVWNSQKDKLPGLSEVGSDGEQNPNDTLIVSKNYSPASVSKLIAALLAIGRSTAPEAVAVRETLGIRDYIVTSENDFAHTLEMLGKAGVTAQYNLR